VLQKFSHRLFDLLSSGKSLKIRKSGLGAGQLTGRSEKYCDFREDCVSAVLHGCRIMLLWLLGNDYSARRGQREFSRISMSFEQTPVPVWNSILSNRKKNRSKNDHGLKLLAATRNVFLLRFLL
jgi:hypothetical protein